MPTLVATFTLVGLLKMAHVDMPRWHLAAGFAAMVGFALLGGMSWAHLAANVAGSFGAAWAYFIVLDRTDTAASQPLHWLVLFGGLLALVGSRFWLDLKVYGIGL